MGQRLRETTNLLSDLLARHDQLNTLGMYNEGLCGDGSNNPTPYCLSRSTGPIEPGRIDWFREMMVEENDLYICGLDELLGSDDYLEEPEVGAMAAGMPTNMAAGMTTGMAGCRIRFNVRGPGNLRKMPMTTVVSSDGFDMDVDRLYTWAPAPVQTGHSVPEVEEFVASVFRFSKSWMAAGIALRRVPFEEAQCIVQYVPGGQTRCGQGAAGCASGPDSRRLIEMVEDVFGKHKGLMHELIHAFGHGAHNRNGACPSVMGMSRPGIWPTLSDLSSTRAFAHS